MTSPLSLLSLLAPAPAEGTAPNGEDPAAFAAALLAVLAAMKPAVAPVRVTVADPGQPAPEEEAAPDPDLQPAPEGRPQDSAASDAEALVTVDDTAVELPETNHVDPGALVPLPESEAESQERMDPVLKAAPAEGRQPAAKAAGPHHPIALPGDVVQEPKPLARSFPVERLARVEQPAARPTSDLNRSDPTPPVPVEERPPQIVRQAPLPVSDPPAPAVRPRREKGQRQDESARAEAASGDAPAATAAPALGQVMQAAREGVRPVILARPEEQRGGDQAAADSPRRDAQVEAPAQPAAAPTEGLEEWSTAGNARLATQVAELMDGLNLTEFRVDLARRAPQPATLTGRAPAQDGNPADAASTAPVLRVATSAAAPAAPVMPASELFGATILNRPGEPRAPRREDTPPALTSGARVDDDLAGTPAPAPTLRQVTSPPLHPGRGTPIPEHPPADLPLPSGALRRPVEQGLPVNRQELPSAEPAAARPTSAAPERTEARRERPSDPAAPGSAAGPTPAERIATRGDEVEARGAREARNLPNPDGDLARPAGSADRVTVQVSDGEGRATRIRVSVIGDQVRAVITPPDAESARQLEHRMDELQSALARQGFTVSSVSVQSAEARQGGDALAGGLGVATGEARMTPGRDAPAGDQRQGRGQRDQQSAGGQERQQHQGRSRDQGAQQRRR